MVIRGGEIVKNKTWPDALLRTRHAECGYESRTAQPISHIPSACSSAWATRKRTF
jgi:hypothetical protein